MEKIFTLNLRKKILKDARWRRAECVVREVKEFVKKHCRVKEVKLEKNLNEKIWRNAQKPAYKLRLKVQIEKEVARVDIL